MKTIVSINGTMITCEPISMTVIKDDIYSDNTKRSAETGRLLTYPIRYDIITIDLEYILTEEQTAELENLIRGSNLNVKFYDGGVIKSANMYPSRRTKIPIGTADDRKYRLTFSLIEL